ncbi:MAG TPA: ArsR family transcriptional regulator [Bacilli bacterium]
MLLCSTDEKSLKIYEALASKTRLEMIKQLAVQPLNIKELANALGLSSATITTHIQKLEEAGLIINQSLPGKHGHQKVCFLAVDSFQAYFRKPESITNESSFHYTLQVGHYHHFSVNPSCGMATTESVIGEVDNPRYFSDPNHFNANIIWFTKGFVEYRIPNYALVSQQIISIEFSLEICSEAPGYNENWPSDITFHFNGVAVGTWTCPGDFGSTKGILTPNWYRYGSEYGLLKTVRVTENGSYLDGIKLSEVTVHDLLLESQKDITLRIEASEQAQHAGGMVLFGKGYGNYNQDIEVYLNYIPLARKHV